jgi:hypothetical protein
MGGRRVPIEQPCLAEQERSRADAGDVGSGPVHPTQPRNYIAVGRQMLEQVGVERGHHDKIASPYVGKGRGAV